MTTYSSCDFSFDFNVFKRIIVMNTLEEIWTKHCDIFQRVCVSGSLFCCALLDFSNIFQILESIFSYLFKSSSLVSNLTKLYLVVIRIVFSCPIICLVIWCFNKLVCPQSRLNVSYNQETGSLIVSDSLLNVPDCWCYFAWHPMNNLIVYSLLHVTKGEINNHVLAF